MTADANPLQGSLFGDLQVSDESQNSPKGPEIFNKDFNEEALAEDALIRPRKRNADTNLRKSRPNSEKSRLSIASEELPNWHHHSLIDLELLTPVLRHYVELKAKNPDRVLLYRLGDFFECFFEDAITLSRLLELTLTSKEGGKNVGKVPMAGIPHHSVERYCAELINKGLSVALCDQLESSPSKGTLIKREITRILTPGTVIEEGMLQARRNNWLSAVVINNLDNEDEIEWGLANADVSTGELLITQSKNLEFLSQELSKIQPSEIVWEGINSNYAKKFFPNQSHIKEIPSIYFNEYEAQSAIKKHYKINTIDGLGLNDYQLGLKAAGGILGYLSTTKEINIEAKDNDERSHVLLEYPQIIIPGNSLLIDSQTRKNLELTSTQKDNQFHGSLLWSIDRTLTAMGGRSLRRWVEAPLLDADEIRARQLVISRLVKNRKLRQEIRKMLRSMGDLERLAGRAGAGQAGGRDLIAIADGLERLPKLSNQIKQIKEDAPSWFQSLININPNLIEIASTIKYNLIDNPPLSITEGGLIYDGVDKVLDGLRNQLDDQDMWIKSQELKERKESGNNNLRIQYHRTFGYFLAVSKAKSNLVPNHWIRRQTLSNEERFITPALKEREGQIFQAKARSSQKEYEIFCKIRDLVGKEASAIRNAAKAVAGLDALASLAEVAATNNYCLPEIIDNQESKNKRVINIKKCRHPVVEQLLADSSFEANNISLGEDTDLIILTGPNASGKSCYLRQIGLIQLLAQMGSWVPAQKASLSITDRIFTRVGAVDDLAAGQSTFMVEMTETAYILNQATNRSLVLLDEIGRGTATFDGLSIAWSVSEFLAKEIKSRTVFATHYHELNALSSNFKNVSNFQVLVKETGEKLLFLHKVVPGGASRSYGIEAARLAGVPKNVIRRAKEILIDLEQEKPTPENTKKNLSSKSA